MRVIVSCPDLLSNATNLVTDKLYRGRCSISNVFRPSQRAAERPTNSLVGCVSSWWWEREDSSVDSNHFYSCGHIKHCEQ